MTSLHGPMTGQVCIVTGATSGIGLATARGLAQQGATVIIVARNRMRGEDAVAQIQQESNTQSVGFLVADLSVQTEVRDLAQTYQRRYGHLDVLVNNAGGFFMRRRLSVDGLEMTLALNYLGPFLLTNLLLETLKASTPARIVNVSSDIHRRAKLDFDDLQATNRYRGQEAYALSKLCVVLFTYELARRLDRTGVTANAVTPGFVATKIGQNSSWMVTLAAPFLRLIAASPEEGAQSSIFLASSPEVEGVSGRYFARKETVSSSPTSYDEAAARRLWEISAQMTSLGRPDSG